MISEMGTVRTLRFFVDVFVDVFFGADCLPFTVSGKMITQFTMSKIDI